MEFFALRGFMKINPDSSTGSTLFAAEKLREILVE